MDLVNNVLDWLLSPPWWVYVFVFVPLVGLGAWELVTERKKRPRP